VMCVAHRLPTPRINNRQTLRLMLLTYSKDQHRQKKNNNFEKSRRRAYVVGAIARVTATLDGESRRLLGVVVADIERLGLAAPTTPGGLEILAVRFEADHPAVAATLRQVGDLLGKAGI